MFQSANLKNASRGSMLWGFLLVVENQSVAT